MRPAACLIALSLALIVPARAQDLTLKIVAFNDLHGNIESPGHFRANPQSPSVPAGGADYLAAYIAQLRSRNPHNIVVSAGDLTGASPLVARLFHDEDTIEVANRLGLELNAVGNHEFDNGLAELLRKQRGGCRPHDSNSCQGAQTGTPVPFEGARFTYLAANVYNTATGKTIFPGYAIKTYDGVQVAFIGLTLKDTPSMSLPQNMAGLRFTDEADTVNAIVQRLRGQGIASFVVLIHQGGLQLNPEDTDINACAGGLDGSPIQSIVRRLDDAVDLVISAHTHQPYICQLPNRTGRLVPVTSASAYGRVVTDIDLTIDKRTNHVTHIAAHNILVDRTNPAITPDPAIKAIIDRYSALAAPIVNRVVGTISATIPRELTPSGETVMGDVITDAQLEATRAPRSGGAVVAFVNEGGIRAGLPFASTTPGVPDGTVTFGELAIALPFGNNLVTMTLTGAQIHAMLEELFPGCTLGYPPGITDVPQDTRHIEVSDGFSYSFHPGAPPCHRVVPHSIRIHGAPLVATASYRITVNNLLADGGEQLYVFRQGTHRRTGPLDMDAMTAYFAHHPALAPPPLHRITLQP